jgi:hypothetical protein
MPSSEQHFYQAKHNLDFLKSFGGSYNFADWAITVGFYTSVHIFENAFAIKKTLLFNKHSIPIEHSDELGRVLEERKLLPDNEKKDSLKHHRARKLLVVENFPEIAFEYDSFYTQSITARYANYSYDKTFVQTYINLYLNEIVKWSNKTFKTKLPTVSI